MPSDNKDQYPTRLAALSVTHFLCDYMIQARSKLNLDYDQIIIASFIVSRSAGIIFDSEHVAENYGYEPNALPLDERFAVTMKEIETSLRIPRETLRRKLLSLIDRGVIIKTSEGYLFPPQVDEMDLTSEFRKSVVECLGEFMKKVELIDRVR